MDNADTSDTFATAHKNPYKVQDNIAAKQIQRLCPSVDTTSLQNKGEWCLKSVKHPCQYFRTTLTDNIINSERFIIS